MHLDSAEVERMDSQTRQEVSVQRAGGFELSLWIPESLMIDPHALSVDNRGRAYVAASGRTRIQRAVHSHITDQYSAMLAHQTLEDLRSFLHRELAPKRSNENEDWLPAWTKMGHTTGVTLRCRRSASTAFRTPTKMDRRTGRR